GRQGGCLTRGGEERGGNGDQRGGYADGESGAGGTDNHHAARESDGDGGTDGHVHGGGYGHGTAELPVAEERGEYRRGHGSELHHTGNHDGRQWSDFPS